MKRVLIMVGLVAVVGLLATATAVVAWGGARSLVNHELAAGEGRGRGGGGQNPAGLAPEECGSLAGEEAAHEWILLEGKVVEGTGSDGDIVVETADGQLVTVGTGPSWLQAQGFVLETGDQVTIRGFWEDDEFKAGEITRERDQAHIVLRDESGRPAWSGQGRGASAVGARGAQRLQLRDSEGEGQGLDQGPADGSGAGSRGANRGSGQGGGGAN